MGLLDAPGTTPAAAATLAHRSATQADNLGNRLTKVGAVIQTGSTGAFDAAIVESLSVIRDPQSGRLVGVYTGYTGTYAVPAVGSIGLAYSDDGIYWDKWGPTLTASGSAGSPDFGTVTGPLLRYENGTYYLFYIGASAAGYEAGVKSICLATATSPKGPWTRLGAAISPGGGAWRNYPTNMAVWHPSIVKRNGTYYLFFNANDSTGAEVIGYATATALTGPWTVDDANSPLIGLGTSTSGEGAKVGDPCVRRIGDTWVMDYYGVNNGVTFGAEYQATTTDALFPLGWTRAKWNPVLAPTAGGIDSKYAHKPGIYVERGELFHYYTADNGTARCIAAAVGSSTGTTSASTVRDFFRRTTTGLGTADTGQVWTSDTGWNTNGTQAVWSGSVDGASILDSGVADNFEMGFVADVVTVSGYSYGVYIDYTSSTVYKKIYKHTNGTWVISVSGTVTAIGQVATVASGDRFALRVRGKSLVLLINGVQQGAFIMSAAPTATKQGFAGTGNAAFRASDFYIRPI